MKTKSRPLNQSECFICSFKEAKDVFKDTDITLDFGYLGRDYGTFANTPDARYLKTKIQGRVVASMYMSPRQACSILSFYVIKKNTLTTLLIQKFEKDFLPIFYEFYQMWLYNKEDDNIIGLMLVELLDGKLKLHQINYR